MLANEQEPKIKKKKKGLLSERMGLDQGSETFAPPRPRPGILPGSPEAELNARAEKETLGTAVQDKLKNRRSNGR